MSGFGGPAQSTNGSVEGVERASLPFLFVSILSPNQDSAILGTRRHHVHIRDDGGRPGKISHPIAVPNIFRYGTRWIFHPLTRFWLFHPKSYAIVASSRHQSRMVYSSRCVGS